MNAKILVTQEGLDKLKTEYDNLVNVKRPKVIEDIRRTREMGDLSENGGYQAAREEQRLIDSRIAELGDILKNAEVVEKSKANKVNVGNKVIILNLEDNTEQQYSLVGPTEANPSEKKISYESPIGKKLVNKSIGDEVIVETPGGSIKYKILKIE